MRDVTRIRNMIRIRTRSKVAVISCIRDVTRIRNIIRSRTM